MNGQSTTTVPNVAFTLQGAKTIGTGPSGPVYKYSATLSSDASGHAVVSNLEWDNYTVSVPSSTGYDIASACNPQPETLPPDGSVSSTFYLIAHTTNSLLVDVRDGATGATLPGAYVQVAQNGTSVGTSTDPCGQSFFSGLASASNYTVAVGALGHATSTISNVNVSGQSRLSVQLN